MSEKQRSGSLAATTTITDVIAAPGAGFRLHITDIQIAFQNASITGGGALRIYDGAVIKNEIPLSATATFSNVSLRFAGEGLRLSDNTALRGDLTAALVAGTAKITAYGYMDRD